MGQKPYSRTKKGINPHAIIALSWEASVSACPIRTYEFGSGAFLDPTGAKSNTHVLKQETLHQNQNEIPIKPVYNLDLSLLQRGTVIDGALLCFWILLAPACLLASGMTFHALAVMA